jgi:hypothetical protein
MSTSDSGRHPHVPDRVRAGHAVELVLGRDRLGVAEVLDDLQRVPEREHLGAAHVLDPVGERLEVAVVGEVRLEGVLASRPRPRARRAERAQAPLDLRLVAPHAVVEVEVARRVRVGQLDAHDPVRPLGGPYSA